MTAGHGAVSVTHEIMTEADCPVERVYTDLRGGGMMKYAKFILVLIISAACSFAGSCIDSAVFDGNSDYFATIFVFSPSIYLLVGISCKK